MGFYSIVFILFVIVLTALFGDIIDIYHGETYAC